MALLCSQQAHLYTHPFQIIFRDPTAPGTLGNLKGLLYTHCKIWAVVRLRLAMPHKHSHTPLWDNPGLKELLTLPGRSMWLARGVRTLSDVYQDNTLKSFQQLKDDFVLPNSMHFRYLQLRHALLTQFHDGSPNLEQLDILHIIVGQDSSKLISIFYNALIRPTAVTLAYGLKNRWAEDVGELEDDEWEDALDNCKAVSTRLADRLTQLYILHRSYLTPIRLARFKAQHNPLCPRCDSPSSSFFHLIWTCPAIQDYWSHVVQFIHDEMGSPLRLCPKQCLLGICPDPDSDKFHIIFLKETLFIARLLIARKWLRIETPTIQEWIAAVNIVLPYKKEIYAHIGCPSKYEKIWNSWLGNSTTCNSITDNNSRA